MTLCDKVTKKNELSVPVMVEHEDKKEGECVLSMDGLGDKIWTGELNAFCAPCIVREMEWKGYICH